jgi:predicted aconitase
MSTTAEVDRARVEGTDVNFTLATHTGVSKKDAKPSDPQPKMKLTPEEQEIMDGKKRDLLQKAMKTVVAYGEAFGAEKLVTLTGPIHMAMSWGNKSVAPFLDIYDKFVEAGMKTYRPFCSDPLPMDFENNDPGPEKRASVAKTYPLQDRLEKLYLKIGLADEDSYSCASYLPEMGNAPKKGDLCAWSESSAINYANSICGGRTNRNSMGIDMMCSLLGKAPLFGLLTDEGRKAKWLIEVKTTKKPNPMLLGSAIGLKCVEEVPFVAGLKEHLGELDDVDKGYLKDLGATTASNGAEGLVHYEGLSPEAVEQGRDLLVKGYQTYVIDDAELKRVFDNYPDLWPDHNKGPEKIFVGCPHLTVDQLHWATGKIKKGLTGADMSKPSLPLFLFTGRKMKNAFIEKHPEDAKYLDDIGVKIALQCPMMYLQTPIQDQELIVTNSNKCRVYSTARFFFDDKLINIVRTGKLPKDYVNEEPEND